MNSETNQPNGTTPVIPEPTPSATPGQIVAPAAASEPAQTTTPVPPTVEPAPAPQSFAPGPQPVGLPSAPAADPGMTMAIIGLVFAIIFSPVGIVLSLIAKNTSKKAGFKNTIATVGIVVSIVMLIPYLILLALPLFAGHGTKSSSSTGTSTNSVVSQSNDETRKADIRAIQIGLEEYYADNNAYPSSLTVLVTGKKAYLPNLPTDPANSGAHVYVYVPSNKNQSYKLMACLDATTSTGSGTYQPIAPCTTSSFVKTNVDGQ